MLSTILKKQTTYFAPLARVYLRRQSTSPAPNEELIQVLSRYMEEEKSSTPSNSHKVRAYSKAIRAIGRLPEQVRSVEQVRDLDGIGVRIAERIDAYLSGTPYEPPTRSESRKKGTDSSPTEHTRPKPRKTLEKLRREQVVSSLLNINGIGPSRAKALYEAGCTSLGDLKEPKFLQMLSHCQRINVEHGVFLDRRMTLEQATTVHDFVRQSISSKYTVLLGGDFRRGAATAQQISIVVLHPQSTDILAPEGSPSSDSTTQERLRYVLIPAPFTSRPESKTKFRRLPETTTFSTEIISPLESRGLIAACTTAGLQKWCGVIRIPERSKSETTGNGWGTRKERLGGVEKRTGQFFSAEIYYVPRRCAGAALIALTGDAPFNVAIRRAACRRDFRLDEYGLWRWQGTVTTTPANDGGEPTSMEQHSGRWELAAGEREEDIFEAVGMEWVAPERRNFGNLNAKGRKMAGGQ